MLGKSWTLIKMVRVPTQTKHAVLQFIHSRVLDGCHLPRQVDAFLPRLNPCCPRKTSFSEKISVHIYHRDIASSQRGVERAMTRTLTNNSL